MAEKRKDSRGRILRTGESQRKDGRYCFTYTDSFGKKQFIYSWKLVDNDPLPDKKRSCKSLRTKVNEMHDLIKKRMPISTNTTVAELCNSYYAMVKNKLKITTQKSYEVILRSIESDSFGSMKVTSVKKSTAKSYFIRLQSDKGYSMGYIRLHTCILIPAFNMAIDDDIINKNPFKFPLSSILVDDGVQRNALSLEDEKALLDYVQSHPKYQSVYNAIYVMLNTGVRIGELCAITISDIDFKNRILHINKQLVHLNNGRLCLLSPKTKAGTRDIPISEEVCDCFKREIKSRYCRVEPVVDGRTGFVFLTKSGLPITQGYYNKIFKAVRYQYNKEHTKQLPFISPHVCRHTFSSKMAMAGMNVKVLQYIMGHEHVSTTMDIYTHVDFSVVAEEMNRICTTA